MDFSLSAEQSALRESVARYCQRNYGFQSRQRLLRTRQGFSEQHWAAFAEFGWLGASLPEDVGGSGGSVIDAAIILEEFGRALVLEPYLPCAILTAQVVNAAGDFIQRKAILEPMIQGKSLLALAHAEPASHHATCSVSATAMETPDGDFILNGSKVMVLNGNMADSAVVSAYVVDQVGTRKDMRLFTVNTRAQGVLRRCFRTQDGSGAADIAFKDVRVAKQDMLNTEGAAEAILEDALNFATVCLCADAVGGMDVIISTTTRYLKERKAYNTTLSTFQALQHRLADMLIELEMSRSILFRGFSAFMRGDRRDQRRATSAAKALIGSAGRMVSADGIQLHGGMGMVDDYIIGQLFKRLTVVEGLFGNSDFHLQRHFYS